MHGLPLGLTWSYTISSLTCLLAPSRLKYTYLVTHRDKWIGLPIHTCTCTYTPYCLWKCTLCNEQYLAWRVLTALHHTTRMSFMLVGHTTFAPDWCFGLYKQRYRCTFVSSLEDIAEVVKASADVNVAQLVGTQSGQPIVPVYDWVNFFTGHFSSIPQLKSFQHFILCSSWHCNIETIQWFQWDTIYHAGRRYLVSERNKPSCLVVSLLPGSGIITAR